MLQFANKSPLDSLKLAGEFYIQIRISPTYLRQLPGCDMSSISHSSVIEFPISLVLHCHYKLADGYRLQLTAVPGHSDDHCAPTLFQNGRPVFCFSGESCGALCRAPTPISMPTSMPPTFNFETCMDSCRKVASLAPEILGFGHFGAIDGKAELTDYLAQHQKFAFTFGMMIDLGYRKAKYE